jgi:RNA-splicing ligase RtcB
MAVPSSVIKVSETAWEIPTSYKAGMRVPARIYATEKLLKEMDDGVFDQVTNVAMLPGIVKYALCMPDGHWGYGFPIGGVMAVDADTGVISPGGIGFDINCGMRLVVTNLTYDDVKPHLKPLVDQLFQRVPAGVGSSGFLKLSPKEFREVIEQGARWCVHRGLGWEEDLERTEEEGCIDGADARTISQKAVERGLSQVGTLGSGNHYLEIQIAKPEHVFDKALAERFGITIPNQVVVMFHCLPGDTRVMTEHGYRIPIERLAERWSATKVKCMEISSHQLQDSEVLRFYRLNPCGKVFKLITTSGRELIATEEHPLLTPGGLKPIGDVQPGERVAVLAFEGVDYEDPSDEVIVDEAAIRAIADNDRIVRKLKKRGLLPLRMNSPQLPVLVRLLGFLTGDGWLGIAHDTLCGRRRVRWKTTFTGRPDNLEQVRADVAKLGYRATIVHHQHCVSRITSSDGLVSTINGQTSSVSLGAISLPILFRAMGAPAGSKARVEFDVPGWLWGAPLWIKRLYLAGYCGAEMTRPNLRPEGYGFGRPTLSLNKVADLEGNGREFLQQIARLLREFGVETAGLTVHAGVIGVSGTRTVKLRLSISGKAENLQKLWGRVGFEYCADRTARSAHATQYLRRKRRLVEREALHTNTPINSLWSTAYAHRVGLHEDFASFMETHRLNPPTPVIWDVVEQKEELRDFKGPVYDLTVAHPDHNFIANGFVTGNCGSRGFGHQTATDYLQVFLKVMPTYGISVPDRELACAPFNSPQGQDYFAAMKCGINMSFANRQVILHRIREVFSKVLGRTPEALGMRMVYDVAHNTAKLEDHLVDGQPRTLLVHRKGSTRAFGPGMKGVPDAYKDVGQPVIIGGSMETGSYLLVGVPGGAATFFTTAHGSGRTMSRTKAKKLYNGKQLQQQMESRGIYVRSVSYAGLAEEAGGAYKDIDEVIETTEQAGLSKRVARFVPIGNVKG